MLLSHVPRGSGIYSITHIASGKRYVGSATRLYTRGHTHLSQLRKGIHCNRHLQNAWKSYGASAFAFEVLEMVAIVSALREREQFHIERLGVCNRAIGYNLALSATRVQFSDETRQLISALKKGRKVSEETRQKLSLALKGRKLGPQSAEHSKRIGDSHKGKSKSVEHCKRIATARAKQDPKSLSHPHTQETKDRLRARVLPPLTPEQRRKISEHHAGRKRGPMSAETKAKIGAKAKARGKFSDAHRKALSDASNRIRGHYSVAHGAAISAGKKRAFALRRAASAIA